MRNVGVAPPSYPLDGVMTLVDAGGRRAVPLAAAAPGVGGLQPGASLVAAAELVVDWTPAGGAAVGLSFTSARALRAIRPASMGVGADGLLWVNVTRV